MSDDELEGFDRRNGQGDDDDDYDFQDNNTRDRQNQRKGNAAGDDKGQVIQNQHYDEALDVSDAGSEIQSDPDPEPQDNQQEPEMVEKQVPKRKFEPIRASADSEAGDEDKEDKKTAGAYDPANYAHLNVSKEVKDLFTYITRYRPTSVDLDTKIKAFIPDFIPAVGEVDAFLKPSRPDDQKETLGLLTIDEPCLNQSKESTIRLIMNAFRKTKVDTKKVVDSIENAERNPKEINKWIQDVNSIQRHPPSVVYSKPFPDIDNLMQVWPAEIEDALQNLQLPTDEVDMSLEEYARLCCALVDIPVHQTNNGKNLIESMHVFFTLYDEFRANQHFQQQNEQFVYEGNM